MLGYSAATINEDETGRNLVALLSYHICLLVIYLTAFLFCGIIFLIILASQSKTALTWGTFLSSAAAFTLAYLVYFEFEFVYRTYLFYWKTPLKHANERYAKREATGGAGNSSHDREKEVKASTGPPVMPFEKD